MLEIRKPISQGVDCWDYIEVVRIPSNIANFEPVQSVDSSSIDLACIVLWRRSRELDALVDQGAAVPRLNNA